MGPFLCTEMKNNTIISRLVTHFLGGYPLTHIFEKPFQNISWEDQINIRDKTIRNPLVKEYPLKRTYIKAFLKQLIKVLETNSEYVHDDFYNDLCEIINSNVDETYCFKHFLLQNETDNSASELITVKESSKLISDGTTGLRTWEAALVLAEWCLCNRSYFYRKKVLELGSGVGLTGMMIAKYCGISRLWMSDCHNQVLKMLYENLDINFPNSSTTEDEMNVYKNIIDILRLPWEEISDLPKQIVPDLVIGADIVYDPSIFEPLCDVFKHFGSLNEDTRVILVNTVRNENTNNEFFMHLDKNDFKVRRLDMIKSQHLIWDENRKYDIMEIMFR